jgi:hypothetical protein
MFNYEIYAIEGSVYPVGENDGYESADEAIAAGRKNVVEIVDDFNYGVYLVVTDDSGDILLEE